MPDVLEKFKFPNLPPDYLYIPKPEHLSNAYIDSDVDVLTYLEDMIEYLNKYVPLFTAHDIRGYTWKIQLETINLLHKQIKEMIG